MSKEEITLEQAMEAVQIAKDAVKGAKADLKAFRKEHNLKPDDVPGEEKVVKQLTKLTNKLAKAEEELEAAQEVVKGLKPATVRATVYVYPAECVTAADKKKHRAKMRRAKKSAEKGETKVEGKAKKSEAAPEAPAAEEGKKKKKKSEQEED